MSTGFVTVEAGEVEEAEKISSFEGTPALKCRVICSGVSGASCMDLVSFHISAGGVTSGSSRIPASYEMWKRFSSVDHGFAVVCATGMPLLAANSSRACRPAKRS